MKQLLLLLFLLILKGFTIANPLNTQVPQKLVLLDCLTDSVTNINITNITTNSATIEWDSLPNVALYYVDVYLKGTNGNSYLYTLITYSPTINVNLLASGTNYHVEVQALCGGGGGYSLLSSIEFRTIIVNDVLQNPSPGCSMTVCSCTSLVNIIPTTEKNPGDVIEQGWWEFAMGVNRVTYRFTFTSLTSASIYTYFKISWDSNPLDIVSLKRCKNNTDIRAVIQKVGTADTYIKIFKYSTGETLARVDFTKLGYKITVFEGIKIKVDKCDECYNEAALTSAVVSEQVLEEIIGAPKRYKIVETEHEDIDLIGAKQFLLSCTPNPFNDQFELRYELPESGDVYIYMTDEQGRIIKNIANGNFENKGFNSKVIDNQQLTNGLYYVKLQCGDYEQIIKVLKEN